MHPFMQEGKQSAVFTYLVVVAARIASEPAGSCVDHPIPTWAASSAEITKAAVVRNVANEGTASNNDKTPFGTEL